MKQNSQMYCTYCNVGLSEAVLRLNYRHRVGWGVVYCGLLQTVERTQEKNILACLHELKGPQ